LLNKFFIPLFFSVCIFLDLHADNKQLIINQLINTDNITFDFEQTTNNKKEFGTCVLVFDNKLNCDYVDSMQKRILINDQMLVVQQKRYNKIYFYPLSKSSFVKIFNKDNLIGLIKKSDYKLNNDIELSFINSEKEETVLFFERDNYNFIGWKTIDQLQNMINFSIKIKYINTNINSKIFKIPSIN
tara:strand:+ start:203 stop:760 length:558 start_codon:yes stop_codon:yes gene_type:complete